jgi:hypothetical protein
MSSIIKSFITVLGFLAAISVPLKSVGETIIFSEEGLFGDMSSPDFNHRMYVYASESATQIKSNVPEVKKTNTPGAQIGGTYYRGSECWSGYGFTDNIQFKATGSLPKQVSASGSALVTWEDQCSNSVPYPSFTDNVSFTMNVKAISDITELNRYNTHREFGRTKVITHVDTIFAWATPINSYISSETFGEFIPVTAHAGKSKSHETQIIK